MFGLQTVVQNAEQNGNVVGCRCEVVWKRALQVVGETRPIFSTTLRFDVRPAATPRLGERHNAGFSTTGRSLGRCQHLQLSRIACILCPPQTWGLQPEATNCGACRLTRQKGRHGSCLGLAS